MLETSSEKQLINPQERVESIKAKLGITSDEQLADALEDLSMKREREAEERQNEERQKRYQKEKEIEKMKSERDEVLQEFREQVEKEGERISTLKFSTGGLKEFTDKYRISAAEMGLSDEESGLVVKDGLLHGIVNDLDLGKNGFLIQDLWSGTAAVVPRDDGSDIIDIYIGNIAF